MQYERRVIRASIYTGLTEILIGIILVLTHIADWYYNTFHFFGIFGFSMITYATWHWILLKRDELGDKY
jgi:hypothetical protein